MKDESKVITCVTGPTVRDIVAQAAELEIAREDIVNIFPLGGQIYLIYYTHE